jgi:ribA/ribD-fused uncharacterized protein
MIRIDRFSGNYHFLSNFYPHPVRGAHGIVYPTAEAAFHGGKTATPWVRAWIAAAPTPSEAKRRGRLVALRPGWDQHRHVVMRAVLETKFTDRHLANRLLETGDAVLVEGNHWHDQYWRCCRCGRPACAEPGENWLGRHLMDVRADLAARRADAPSSAIAA